MVESDRRHDFRHRQRGLSCFGAAIVFSVETTCAGLGLIFQEQHLVNDWNFVGDLDLHECVANGFANVRRVSGFTP